jgi:hypothetical protein
MFETRRRSGRTLIGAAAGMAVASMTLAGCCNGPCGRFLECQLQEYQNSPECDDAGYPDAGPDAGSPDAGDAGLDGDAG